jgi:hypothetical protein
VFELIQLLPAEETATEGAPAEAPPVGTPPG